MNGIREIQRLNKRELEETISPEASWHADYRDTAWIYVGGFPYTLSEGDIITIFSQFGEPTHINLVRDKDTGKSKGFAFLKYEDQRSTDLAVDNLGGATVGGRILKVDHTRYKMKEGENDDDYLVDGKREEEEDVDNEESESEEERPPIKEEIELRKLLSEYDDEDPMKEYLVKEKKEEVARALAKLKKSSRRGKDEKHRHSHRHHHRKRIEDDESRHSRKDDRYKRDRDQNRPRSSRDEIDLDDYRKRRRRDEDTSKSRDRKDYDSDEPRRRRRSEDGPRSIDQNTHRRRSDDSSR
ncbi:MAG: hypothetical protein M1834_006589 [Cirrosporium novae-zelandiae]|nr:MAG: hypothetical protein M1834_006589 [Cirrosporium novae-zelandiae]